MDNFDVLVESIGFKSQSSRSTPLSKLKSQPTKPNFPPPQQPPPPTSSIHHSNISGPGTGIDLDAFFVGNSSSSAGLYHHVDDDIFGLNSIKNSHDDLISGLHSMGSLNGGNTEKQYPGHSGAPSYPSSSFAVDPFSIFESSSSSHEEKSSSKNASSIDELEAFAMGSSQNNGSERFDAKISNEAVNRVQEKLSNSKYNLKKGNAASDSNIKVSLPRKEGRASKVTHGSQDFSPTEKVSTRGQTNKANNSFGNEDLLGSWFTEDSRTTTKTGPKSEIKDDILDSLVSGKTQSNMENTSSQSSRGTKKAPVNTNYVDDFLVFGEPAPSAVEFFEIDGEPEERRRARYNQHMRTKERMAKALSEKNQRDLHAQNEQEERRRLAESMDNNLKRWAAGKEGNLRALLSSLQHVLWAESGWQPVSLTDMITSVSVKKVYHRATLCVHPDKVQQKGATLQQKYIAEKVFDLLKEAWNKFNEQELR